MRVDGLDEEQAAIYDRQLRVWGVEAQRRISASRLLFIGSTGLAAEAAKNAVLAGCGRVHLFDTPGARPGIGNFLVGADDGDDQRSVPQRCAAALREMNPFVEVQGTEGDPASFTTDALREYDLVVCAGVPLSTARLLAGRCREAGVKFACGDCRGTFGWYVLDLGDHGFVVQVPVQGKDEKTLVEKTTSYPSLEEVLSARLSERMRGRGCDALAILRVLDRTERELGRPPGPADAERAAEVAGTMESDEWAPAGGVDRVVLRDYLTLTDETPGLTAVLGGVLGNDLIASVSGKGEPSDNVVSFSMLDGMVCRERRPVTRAK